VDMVLRRWPYAHIVLFGFDSTTKDKPGWEDAKIFPGGNISRHPFVREKQMIADIANGLWMGEPTEAKLTWHNQPDLWEA